MSERLRVLAVVPARGGSKSIPRKNLRPLGGHPLLAWSIAAAQEAFSVDRVLVSTDDPEIREVAIRCGAEAPFLRPEELARDETPDLPLFAHALEWLETEEGWIPDAIVQLRPTSPFRPPGLVDAGVALLQCDPDADSVRAVTSPGQNPYKMWRAGASSYLTPLLQDGGFEAYNRPRQALPPTVWQTGHLDAFRRDTLRRKRSLTGDRVLPLPVASALSIDIDTLEQWDYAEWRLRRGDLSIVRPGARVCPVNG